MMLPDGGFSFLSCPIESQEAGVSNNVAALKRYLIHLLAVVFLSVLSMEAVLAETCGTPRYFDIPAQPLGSALLEFAQQAGVPALFPGEDFQHLDSNTVEGEFCRQEALDALLDGHQVEGFIDDSGQLAIRQGGGEASALTQGEDMQQENSPGRKTLLGSMMTAILAGTVAAPATAQETAADEGALQEITVTGSRVARSGMSAPTPVTVMDSEAMNSLNPGQLIESLDQLPQFFNNTRPDGPAAGAYSSGSAGQSFLNMRGMGANRTLVLLDGRRMVPTSKLGSVDINLIPEAMVERMEIVTGGASAAYGSDAVTGVTNFILNTDFTGFEARVQGGMTDRSDRDNEEISLSFGADIGTRGHVLASAEYYHSDSLFGYDDRDWFRDWSHIDNPDPDGPREITMPNVGSRQYTHGGLITGGPLAGTQFLADGTPAPFEPGVVQDAESQSGGDGLNPIRDNEIYPETTRENLFLYGDYDISDNLTVYAQGIFARGQIDYLVSELAQFSPFGEATVFEDNAYLPDSVRQRMQTAGVSSVPLGRRSSLQDWQDVEGSENETQALTAGFTYTFDNNWQMNGYYQDGSNTRKLNSYTARLDRAYRAMDAVVEPGSGEVVCRSTLSNPDDGCEPANMFGSGNMSQDAVDYIMGWRRGTQDVDQKVAELTVDGEVYNGLAAGPVVAAFGASYREESLDAVFTDEAGVPDVIPPDEEQGYQGLPPNLHNKADVYLANEMLDARGGYDVTEVFAETMVPVVENAAWARSFNVNLSARYADYSGSGGVVAWKAGADWQINDAVRLRLTQSRDTRAANLGERYDWQRTSTGVDDPWAGTFGQPPEDGVIQGGNPAVDPELSDTLTWGIVYQPEWLPGLNLSMDYYDVEIEDAIDQVGAQDIIDQCYNEGAFCNQVVRDPDSGVITRVDNIAINISQANVSGVDLEASYSWQLPGAHDLRMRFLTSYLEENSLTSPLGSTIERAGEGTLPEWTATGMLMYRYNDFSANLSARYIGSAELDNMDVEGVDIDDNTVSSATYFNLRLGYDITQGNGQWELFANVQNLFDRDPPKAPASFSGWIGAQHTNGLFDQLGRRYVLGLQYSY